MTFEARDALGITSDEDDPHPGRGSAEAEAALGLVLDAPHALESSAQRLNLSLGAFARSCGISFGTSSRRENLVGVVELVAQGSLALPSLLLVALATGIRRGCPTWTWRRDAGERAEAGRLDLLAQQSPCQLLARLLVGDRVAQQRTEAARHGLGRWLPARRELSESDLRQEVERVVELGERGPIRVRIRSELGLRDTLRSLRGGLGRLGAVASRPVRGEHHGRRLA